jgi:putative transposase
MVVLDIFSRMVVGWAMDTHRDEALVEQAARMAQYGIVVSMSGKGDCYDNELMESFFGTNFRKRAFGQL